MLYVKIFVLRGIRPHVHINDSLVYKKNYLLNVIIIYHYSVERKQN